MGVNKTKNIFQERSGQPQKSLSCRVIANQKLRAKSIFTSTSRGDGWKSKFFVTGVKNGPISTVF